MEGSLTSSETAGLRPGSWGPTGGRQPSHISLKPISSWPHQHHTALLLILPICLLLLSLIPGHLLFPPLTHGSILNPLLCLLSPLKQPHSPWPREPNIKLVSPKSASPAHCQPWVMGFHFIKELPIFPALMWVQRSNQKQIRVGVSRSCTTVSIEIT